MSPGPGRRDIVDEGLEEWTALVPEFDTVTIGLLARLGRVRTHIEATLLPYYADHGLTPAAFYVLSTLRRHPPRFELAQRRLGELLSLTPGTVSVRVVEMEGDGLVTRRRDEHSSRGMLVRATGDGLRRYDACALDLRPAQEGLFSALDPTQRSQLNNLLRALLASYAPVTG